MAWSFNGPTKQARADAITTAIGSGGHLQIYTAAYALLLAEYTWTANMFPPSAANGVLTASVPATNPVTPSASGQAIIARVTNAARTVNVINDLVVGTDVIISNPAISTTTPVSLNSFVSTEAA